MKSWSESFTRRAELRREQAKQPTMGFIEARPRAVRWRPASGNIAWREAWGGD